MSTLRLPALCCRRLPPRFLPAPLCRAAPCYTIAAAMLLHPHAQFARTHMGHWFFERFGKLGSDILWIGAGAAVILAMLALVLPRA